MLFFNILAVANFIVIYLEEWKDINKFLYNAPHNNIKSNNFYEYPNSLYQYFWLKWYGENRQIYITIFWIDRRIFNIAEEEPNVIRNTQ